jgi:hypothetical protein
MEDHDTIIKAVGVLSELTFNGAEKKLETRNMGAAGYVSVSPHPSK